MTDTGKEKNKRIIIEKVRETFVHKGTTFQKTYSFPGH